MDEDQIGTLYLSDYRLKVNKKRRLIKTITWRALIILSTMIIVNTVKEKVFLVVSLNVVNFLLYYIHEIIWEKIE